MNLTLKKIALIMAWCSLVLLTACNQSVEEAEAIVEKAQKTQKTQKEEIVTQAPDFAAIKDAKAKKKAFFDYMRPIVQAENEKILKQRKRILAINQANK